MTLSSLLKTFFFFCPLLLYSLVVVQGQVCELADGACSTPPDPSASESSNGDFQVAKDIMALINWLKESGGFMHDSLEILAIKREESDGDFRHKDMEIKTFSRGDDSPRYKFGLFVKNNATIKEGEQLFYYPPFSFIDLIQEFDQNEEICLLAERLAMERNRHADDRVNSTFFGPYIGFLEKYFVGKLWLPFTWTEKGKDVLETLFEGIISLEGYRTCFPKDNAYSVDHEDYTNMEDQEYWDENIELVMSRTLSTGSAMIPIFDLINHSSDPEIINLATTVEDIYVQEGFGVNALRDLKEGEELIHSFTQWKKERNQDYGFDDYGSGTKELFLVRGFIESYPQRWYFREHAIDVALEKTDDNKVKLVWRSETVPDDDAIFTLKTLQSDLDHAKETLDSWLKAPDDITTTFDRMEDHEFASIFHFIDAYHFAVSLIIQTTQDLKSENRSEYLLSEERYVIDALDDDYFQTYQCNHLLQKAVDGSFDEVEYVVSNYQKIVYYRERETNDTCLYLDGVYQQCTSYWPHYHELVVHKPIKYLSKPIKRALWVGGGDSGVLNEFLKYPTLELAVGLELDQQVTRTAFKHFKSRPHFDNPKVQWWYGDASKSLLMLPKEYFGTFDIVVVDLSDTVFSLSVSSELDVIEAISLLLRPGGVFEMNELFLKKVSNVFEYAVHYQFSDVPKIGDQAAIFASNDIDFLKEPLTDHTMVKGATLLVENDSLKTKDQFDRVHDFRRNPDPVSKKLCEQADFKEVEKPQETAPGIMMIVEAENLTADLESPKGIRKAIVDALEDLGMHTLPNDVPSLSSRFIIVMKEGYISVRLWSDAKYCALDINLWSAFNKHDDIKDALVVKALGGNLQNRSTSAYRIVAGGMFGLRAWRKNSEQHGPQVSKLCSNDKEIIRASPSDIKVFKNALETALDIAQDKDLRNVVILCGYESDPCPSVQIIEGNTRVKQIFPIYACAKTEHDDIIDDELFDSIQEKCTMEQLIEILDKALPEEDDTVNAIIFDWNSEEVMDSAVHFIHFSEYLDLANMFIMGTIDSTKQIWKRKIIINIRNTVGVDPVNRAQVLFNTTTSSLELDVTYSGESMFFKHLTNAVSAARERAQDVTVEIRNVIGGKWRPEKRHMCEDDEFSQVIVESDYDNTDAEAQWNDQIPVGTQSVRRWTNMEEGVPKLLTSDEIVQGCNDIFLRRKAASQVYDNIGGDGVICCGLWETGEAIISWDGRYQVDFNTFSVNDFEEIDSFEVDVLARFSNLEGWLGDIQPRGYNRVVNFKNEL